MDRACAYKRGVAGPNEISQNGGHIQTSNLTALLQRVYTESWMLTDTLTSAYKEPFMAKTRGAVKNGVFIKQRCVIHNLWTTYSLDSYL